MAASIKRHLGLMARAGEIGAAEALTFLREVDIVNMRRGQGWSS